SRRARPRAVRGRLRPRLLLAGALRLLVGLDEADAGRHLDRPALEHLAHDVGDVDLLEDAGDLAGDALQQVLTPALGLLGAEVDQIGRHGLAERATDGGLGGEEAAEAHDHRAAEQVGDEAAAALLGIVGLVVFAGASLGHDAALPRSPSPENFRLDSPGLELY